MRVNVILNLVQRLLLYETTEGLVAAKNQDPQPPNEAAERVLEKLRGHLSKKIGTEGFRTLLARALTLTQARFPDLSAVKVAADGSLIGLREAAEASVRIEGATALVAQLLELLVSFIGEELTRRIVITIWPDYIRDDSFQWPDFVWGDDLNGFNATRGNDATNEEKEIL